MNILFKTKIKCLVLIVLLSSLSLAQSKYELRMKFKALSLDEKKQIVLHASGELEGFYDGFIIFPNFMDRIQGRMKEGGFSFLDYTGLGTLFEQKKQREKLAENKFPEGDLEVFANGFDAEKVLSFRIIPEFVKPEDDTVSIFIKYVLYDFNNEQVDYFNWNAKINLYNKLIRIPLNEEVPIQFFDKKLSNYKLSIFLSKTDATKSLYKIENEKLFLAIKKSTKDLIPINEKYNLDLNFGKSNKLSNEPYSSFLFAPNGETLSNISLIDVEYFNTIEFNLESIDLPNTIYHTKITTPFHIMNKVKEKKYDSYLSKDKIFISEYDVYFLPISLEGDSLVGDLFITIEKLKLEDGIKRWSPIHKRVKVKINKINTNSINTNRYYASLMFKLPEENWSAFFSRSDEEYEIYGYSDYERFINEYININIYQKGVTK